MEVITYETELAMQATLPANLHVDIVSPRFDISRDIVAIIAVMQLPPIIYGKTSINRCNVHEKARPIMGWFYEVFIYFNVILTNFQVKYMYYTLGLHIV